MLTRLLPAQADNRFEGHRAALWLLGTYLALKLVMSVKSILNTKSVAAGADGIPLDSYSADAAREVLMLFSMMALGQLALALVGVLGLVRYRALVPLVYLLLLGEHLGRRLIAASYSAGAGQAVSTGFYINLGLTAVLVIGLVLSLVPARGAKRF